MEPVRTAPGEGNGTYISLIQVETYDGQILTGSIANPRFGQQQFRGVLELIRLVDSQMDALAQGNAPTLQNPLYGGFEGPKGRLPADHPASCIQLEVFYRRNGTWQGALTWGKMKKRETFRSVLELLKLLDAVVGTETLISAEPATVREHDEKS